jgi:hypothetical protein
MGCISVFNLIMNYNNMMSMKNILIITLGWAGAILGQLSDNVIRLVDEFSMKRIVIAPRLFMSYEGS